MSILGARARFLHVIDFLVETQMASDEVHSRSKVVSTIDKRSFETFYDFVKFATKEYVGMSGNMIELFCMAWSGDFFVNFPFDVGLRNQEYKDTGRVSSR